MTCIHIARSLQFSSGPATRWFLAFYCICKFRFQILRLCSNCESSFVLYHDSSRCKFSAKIEITREYETSLTFFITVLLFFKRSALVIFSVKKWNIEMG